jgi:SAM-dependent methyltransferase
MIRKFLKKLISSRGQYLETVCSFSFETNEPKTFVNIGAGDFYKENWFSLDADTEHFRERHAEARRNGRFIEHEITLEKQMPFDDNSVDLFYCSHVLEHFPQSTGEHLLEDVSRCLKPGGLIRIAVPDAALAFRAVRRSQFDYFAWNKVMNVGRDNVDAVDHLILLLCGRKSVLLDDPFFSAEQKIAIKERVRDLLDKEAPMVEVLNFIVEGADDLVNYTNHVNWFDEEKLLNMLAALFTEAWRSSRNASLCVEMQNRELFDRTHPQMSLYVEAIK